MKAWLPAFTIILMSTVFDVVLMSGWFLTMLVAGWSAATVLRPHRTRHQRVFAGSVGLCALLLTTVLGYGSASLVRSDFRSAASSFQSNPQRDKGDLLAKDVRMNWFTRFSLLSYTTAISPPKAQFRIFPFAIEEYDLAGNRLRAGAYD